MTFDIDLGPTDLNINRGLLLIKDYMYLPNKGSHLLIKDYLPTKFEASGAKRS